MPGREDFETTRKLPVFPLSMLLAAGIVKSDALSKFKTKRTSTMTKIRKFRTYLTIPILLIGVLIGGCKESTSDEESPAGTTAAVTLDWSSALTALGVSPSYIDSITVTAAASGMTTVTQNPAATATTASLTVPAGSSRTFTVKLTMKSTHAAKYFTATAAADLTAGVAKTVAPASFAIGETRIVVTDYRNARFVVVDDMSGTGWRVIDEASMTAAWSLSTTGMNPMYDAKIDSKGRVYLAVSTTDGGSGFYSILRLDAFDDASPEKVKQPDGYSVFGLALDETNGWLYYLWNNEYTHVKRVPINVADMGSATHESIAAPSGHDYSSDYGYEDYGITVDSDGNLYLKITNPTEGILKFTPSTTSSTYLAFYDTSAMTVNGGGSSTYAPFDVMVRGDYVYVTMQDINYPTSSGGKIVQLKKSDLSATGTSFGMPSGTHPTSLTTKEFFGPERFLANQNPGFTVIDDGVDDAEANIGRIVHIDDLTGTNWTIYGSDGDGTGNFYFWQQY